MLLSKGIGPAWLSPGIVAGRRDRLVYESVHAVDRVAAGASGIEALWTTDLARGGGWSDIPGSSGLGLQLQE